MAADDKTTADRTKSPLYEILGFDLDDKIAGAEAEGRRYTPTRREWDRAKPYQRKHMTWPQDVIDWIRRNP